ncbi:MAG TPA: hypothetical protein VLK85_35550 [Ramlibacter sp.]|nr:hypothetical protein [Ramlibacter sp.]
MKRIDGEEVCRLLTGVGVVGQIDGHEVIRRSSVLELVDRRCQVEQEVAVADKLLDERNRLLREIPACAAHGDQCIPHAIEWVQGMKAAADVSEVRGETEPPAGIDDRVKS